ncbi:MAG: elongation factor 1-beta [Candidatus Diapherotrites archaeon]|nr:elongation factor 1-beta [Candidatus Diapherotrites archaeon]
MGKVLVIAKLFPQDSESIEKIENSLRNIKSGKLQEIKREPIAFGVNAIKVAITIPDKADNAMEKLEKELSNIDGVNQVEIEGVTLV